MDGFFVALVASRRAKHLESCLLTLLFSRKIFYLILLK